MSRLSTRLVQIVHPDQGRRVALVDGDALQLLSTFRTVYAFAQAAIETGLPLRDLLSSDLAGIALDYNKVHSLHSGWRFLPSFDHPQDPARCLVSSFVNPHDGSAAPASPQWFYKGNGMHLRAHGEPLPIPAFAASGAEEAELAAVYVVDPAGVPRRVGLTPGNEFADPAMAADPLLLSHAKLRAAAVGPELVLDGEFGDVRGRAAVGRAGEAIWHREIRTGEAHARFKLAEIERALFRYAAHRVPGDCHVCFLGGSVSSFADGVRLEAGDEVVIEFQGFGRALRNRIEAAPAEEWTARPL
jgi:hypothetical protein